MIFSSQLGKLDGVSTEEKLKTVSNHLRKMQEELEYRLSVLDSSNISEIDADTTNIFTKGENINNVIADQDGKVSVLQQTVDGFKQQVSDYEKGYSEWVQTVEGFTSTVSDYGNKVSQYQQTVDGFTSQVADYEKGYSSWAQTVAGFQSTVSNYEGKVSQYQQSVDGFSAQVSNYAGQVSQYSQAVDGFSWTVRDLENQMGTMLKLDEDGLYIIDQYGNTVTISGSQIDASTIKVNNLYGSYVYLRNVYNTIAGLLSITGSVSSNFAVDLTSYGALRFTADNGALYLGASGYVTLGGQYASCQSPFISSGDGTNSLGTSWSKWSTAYLASAAVVDSDREKKNSISYDLAKYEKLFGRLMPAVYKYNNGTSDRLHTGFISQDVEDGLEESELTSQDFAGFIKSPKLDENGKEIEGEYVYALRYEEFIALNTHMIQKLMGRVEELEQRVSELEGR